MQTLLIIEGNIFTSSVSSFHILDDHVDTIVVRPVVALLFHNFVNFLVRLAEVGVIDDAWKFLSVSLNVLTERLNLSIFK